MAIIDDIKTLLGSPEGVDETLNVIVDIVEDRLLKILNETRIPEELSYIVKEVTIIRFNQIGSEGMSSHSVDGEAISFTGDEFSKYMNEINNWKDRNRKRLRFL